MIKNLSFVTLLNHIVMEYKQKKSKSGLKITSVSLYIS